MTEQLFYDKLWLVLPVWLALCLSHRYLSVLAARYYLAGARDHFLWLGCSQPGPDFGDDNASTRLFSPFFIYTICTSPAMIVILWYGARGDLAVSYAFRFLAGGVILNMLAAMVGRGRTVLMFRFAKDHHGVTGRVACEAWLGYRASFAEAASFAALFAILYLLSGSVSCLGGAVVTAACGIKQLKRSRHAVALKSSGAKAANEQNEAPRES